MIDVSSSFRWLGNQLVDTVLGDVERRLQRAGYNWLAEATRLAPVDTGALRNSLYFRVQDRTLTVGVGVNYGLVQEFGSRTVPPHPYMRPALNAIGSALGVHLEMEFAPISPGIWQGIHAVGAGFVVPSGIQPRPLTQAQHRHVQEHLMPTSRRLHRGNVRRARMVVRRFD